MNTIKEFMYDENVVRTTVDDDNVLWFVGKDVAKVLGYKNTNAALSKHVEEEDKNMGSQNMTPYITDSLGRKQYPLYINESGMYSLILSSKLPSARKFKHWVTSEVLPNIRKHGAHMTDTFMDKVLEDPDTMIKLIQQIKEERAKNAELQDVIQEQAPKVEYADNVLASEGLMTTTEIAKDFGMSGMRLNKILSASKVIYKRGGKWYLYSEYEDMGLTKVHVYAPNEDNVSHTLTKWTQRGYKFIVEKLRELGHEVSTVREFNDEDKD